MPYTRYKDLANSIECYLDGHIDGNTLLSHWQDCPSELKQVYYQLFHLVSDEDVRQKDNDYFEYQINLTKKVIELLKANDIEKLQTISLI